MPLEADQSAKADESFKQQLDKVALESKQDDQAQQQRPLDTLFEKSLSLLSAVS